MTALPFLEARLFEPEQETGIEPGLPLRLAASRCEHCNRVDFPRRTSCPACFGSVSAEVLAEGAVLTGFTSVLHPPPGGMVETPYHIGVATFPEAVSLLGQLLVDSLDEVSIGDPLDVVAIEVDGSATYGFRPAR